MATEEIGQAPGGEVVQSFTGDEGDLEVDVLLYEELVCVMEDRSWWATGQLSSEHIVVFGGRWKEVHVYFADTEEEYQ